MGKTKKKFIDKNEAQHFHLLHRSQRDEAYAKEERPSDFVLVPAANNEYKKSFLTSVFQHENNEQSTKDHINSLGFKNDGYDYEQHLKVMDGGKFMSKDGQFVERIGSQSINLPEDAFASEFELDRNFQAITLNPEFMDDDIRTGLFEDGDELGEFEQLDDDFVLQIASEPEVQDFDFDAHMAKLLELSERSVKGDSLGKNARGWDNSNNVKGHFLKRKNKITNKYDGLHEFQEAADEEYETDDNEDYDDHENDEDNEDGEYNTKNKNIEIDEEFDKILDEYDDDQIGYISDDENIELDGVIDINDENNEVLNKALEEFIIEHKDIQLYEGCKLEDIEKMKKDIAIFRSNINDDNNNNDSPTGHTKNPINYEKEYSEQIESQKESGEMFSEYTHDIRKALTVFHEENEEVKEIETQKYFQSQEYLRHETVREEWDCETILSTYSTLDNHPTVIKVRYF